MAASSITNIWPVTLPTNGGEVLIALDHSISGTPVVHIGGVLCAVRSSATQYLRVDVPAHAAGAVDIDYSDGNGDAPTLVGALTYVASVSRYYLAYLNHNSSGWNLPRPSAKHASPAGALDGYDVTSNVTMVMGPDVPTPGTGVYNGAVSLFTNMSANGHFYGIYGFVSPQFKGVSQIASGNWTFATAGKAFNSGYAGLGNCDKFCLYVWRPSTNTVVGVIYDNTGDYSHPAGALSDSETWTKATLPGAAVSGIMDGDVLVLEWYGTADATHELVNWTYFNGAEIPGADGASTSSVSVAAYLEAPGNLFASPTVIAPVVTPPPVVSPVTATPPPAIETNGFLSRLKSGLPPWFGDTYPNLENILRGEAAMYAAAYLLYVFAATQTRIKSSTGPFLDMTAFSFFGTTVTRKAGESDPSFLARLLANLFQKKGTRAAIINAVTQATGYTPKVYEPWNTADTGGYGASCGAGYGAAGAYGSLAYPWQGWITAYRVSGVLGGNAGYGTSAGNYGAGSAMHYQSSIQLSASDQAIFDAIESVKPCGTIAWVSLQDPS